MEMLAIGLSIHILHENRLNIKFTLSMVLVTQIIGYFIYSKMGILGVFFIILFILISLVIKTRSIFLSIIIPVISFILLVISEYVAQLINFYFLKKTVVMMKSNSMDLILLGLEIFVILLLLTVAVKALWGKLKIYDIFNKRYGILIAILVIMTFIIFYVNILMGEQQGFTKENIQINSILFSFYFLLLLVVFFVLTRIIIKENNIKNQQLQYERLQEYTANLEELYTDMQKFRHDYINILSTMSEYIREKDIESLERYFSDKIMPISQGMRSNNYKLGALKNLKIQEVKGILSSKLIKSQELNIDTVIEVVEPIENINMDSINLCRCLGIVLDNAIDEAQLCKNPSIRAAVMKREGSVLIVVANTCRSNIPPLYKIYQKGFSTKGEKRGLGLSNLKEIVANYEYVILDTYTKDEHFVQELEIFE